MNSSVQSDISIWPFCLWTSICWQNAIPNNIWRNGKVPLRCFRDADWLWDLTTSAVCSVWKGKKSDAAGRLIENDYSWVPAKCLIDRKYLLEWVICNLSPDRWRWPMWSGDVVPFSVSNLSENYQFYGAGDGDGTSDGGWMTSSN